MRGTIRGFKKDVVREIMDKIVLIAENTAIALGCTAQVEFEGTDSTMLPTINTPLETAHVLRVGAKCFGADKSNGIGLPLPGSEDFAFYLEKVPGAFLGLGTMPLDQKVPIFPHTSAYNFNDDITASGVFFWVSLAEDRLGVKLF